MDSTQTMKTRLPMPLLGRVLPVLLLLGLGLLPLAWSGGQEPVVDAPLSPEEASRTMIVPDGFQVTLFAGEPDVRQPIGFCIDDRGRLWVAEAYSYPHHTDRPGPDRIVILEDVTGNGRFDRRTLFFEGLNYVTGIEVGFGGAWVMSPPYFYFIPDRDGDDVPDGPPEVLLDGFGNHANAHNLANGFAWGPDGWLYGTHGRTNWSLIGRPGTPEEERVRFDGGVWRYHPVHHVWEPFADGTTNPWGIDWDDYGQAFVCNCVNPHLFHVIQGAHYEPWRNRDSSRYAYERIATIADHLHFVGANAVRDGLGSPEEDAAGGGHAHCGTLVYLGDNWPERYRNTVFMNNIHGHRINNDILKRSGSGYVASHGKDLMVSRDLWYMGVTLAGGPDGSVFASDWSDTGECHSVRNTRRETGRIYKISYGQPSSKPVDVAALSNEELVELQLHRNDWWVRHARRLLHERAAAGAEMADVHRSLQRTFTEQTDVPRKLRALWALYVTGGLDDEFLTGQLDADNEHLRGWAVRLLTETASPLADASPAAQPGSRLNTMTCRPPEAALNKFRELAADGDSPLVRLSLASAVQRLAPDEAWPIVEALAARAEDRDDQNLPLLIWYGLEPLVHDDPPRFVRLAANAQIPLVRRHIARRVADLSAPAPGLELLADLLLRVSPDVCGDLLEGILTGFEGRRSFPMPVNWPVAYARLSNAESRPVRAAALRLALLFDDPVALRSLREQAADDSASPTTRRQAIDALVARRVDDLAPLLLDLLGDPEVRRAALSGLAEYDAPSTAAAILDAYPEMSAQERQQALQTLSARRAWAAALLEGVESERIPRTDLTAYTARQIRNLGDEMLLARLNALWGEVRDTAADKARLIADYKRRLTPERLAQGNPAAGRESFQKLCGNCHRLFDAGGDIGPNLTGSQRTNLDYLLENIIDPSASVAKDYRMELVQTTAGRIITGLVVAESETALTLVTVNERIVIPVDEIEARQTSTQSIMPDGLLQQLSLDQVRDLIAYLAGPRQVPLSE